MLLLINGLYYTTNITNDLYCNYTTKTSQYSSKLIKKNDQCLSILKCSHLFWKECDNGYKDPKLVLECLQRSLKIADTNTNSNNNPIELFIDTLNEYLYYYNQKCDSV